MDILFQDSKKIVYVKEWCIINGKKVPKHVKRVYHNPADKPDFGKKDYSIVDEIFNNENLETLRST